MADDYILELLEALSKCEDSIDYKSVRLEYDEYMKEHMLELLNKEEELNT